MLQSFVFERFWLLYFIPAIPVLFLLRWLLFFKYRQKINIAFYDKKPPLELTQWLRFLPPGLLSIAMALVLFALARPQRTNDVYEQNSQGIEIMMVLDISESMLIEDFRPNRLESAKDIAIEFIKGRGQDRIGMVVFAGEAFSLAPLTNDYELLFQYIEDIDHTIIEKPGTAIGSALAVATNRMRETTSPSKVIILLSDGDNTAGNIDPFITAQLARAYNIKIYTIVVGKDGPVPYGKDLLGNTQFVQNTIDEGTLRRIAQIGGGKFYRAGSRNALSEIFRRINKLEKAEYKVNRYKQTNDYYQVYLIWAILFFLLWMLTKNTFMTNGLED
jgi:Ca-activated chloride channel family protein